MKISKNMIISIVMIVITVIGLIFMVIGVYNYKQYKVPLTRSTAAVSLLGERVDKQQKKLEKLQDARDRESAISKKSPVITVNQEGNMDSNLNKKIIDLNNVFDKIYTYNSGTKYEENRAAVLKVVHDEDFADYYKSGQQGDGENAADSLSIKSKLSDVQYYQQDNDQILAVVQYVPYRDASDLSVSGVKSNYAVYLIKGEPGNYSQFSVQKNYSQYTGATAGD